MVCHIPTHRYWLDNCVVDNLIFDRKLGDLVPEKVYSSRTTAFLYGTLIGGLLLFIFKRRWINRVYAIFQKGKSSQKKIIDFANKYELKVDNPHNYNSFNDFIIRKEVHNVDKHGLIAPADSALTILPISAEQFIEVKDKKYSVSRLIKDNQYAKEYEGGYALIFRLAVYDYHRYCFPDSGEIKWQKTINGVLDSVNYKQTGKFSLCSNYRKVNLLETKNFGDIVFIEVGAMLVGRIIGTHKSQRFNRGDEKGYFEFGGSTIVMLVKKGVVDIDEDIIEYSHKGIEIKVCYGERIGVAK